MDNLYELFIDKYKNLKGIHLAYVLKRSLAFRRLTVIIRQQSEYYKNVIYKLVRQE